MQSEDINITIGSDPEFIIMCGDSVENALEIFKKVSEMKRCCDCPQLSERDINAIYLNHPKTYIRESLMNIEAKPLLKRHPRFFAEAFVEMMLNYYDNEITETIDKIIKLLDINEKELNEVTDEPTYFVYKNKQVDKRLTHIMLAIKNKILYEQFNLYEKIPKEKIYDFEKNTINKIIEYYDNKVYPNLEDLPNQIRVNIEIKILYAYDIDCFGCRRNESYFCTTELGCDAQSALGEMRPKHGNNPIEHFNEILKLMEELNNVLSPEIICYSNDKIQVKAGAIIESTLGRFQLGGHIHIGFDELYDDNKYAYLRGIQIQKNIGNFLAIYVGIPLTLIEKTKELTRHNSYGSFASARNGEKYFGIEFRMPSSWLVSPQITIGALSLAYVVSYEFIRAMLSDESPDTNMDLDIKATNLKILYNDYINLTNANLLDNVPELYSEIQQMKLYPEYKEYIDYIFDMIDKKETWQSDTNILSRWAELW